MSFIEALILGIVEGFTEYLPISSTGHLILTSHLLGIGENDFVKSFNIVIQFGAILAVLVLYWRQFLPDISFYKKLLYAFIPAAIIGLLIKDKIDAILGSVVIVAWALIVGGVVLILLDKYLNKLSTQKKLEDLDVKNCLSIGIVQCLAFIPGVSRSAATIAGGLLAGLSRQQAAEFSFFLAVPTLTAAGALKSLKILPHIETSQISYLLVGSLISFIIALLSIKFFIKFVTKVGFTPFGIYRIILGTVILIFVK